MTKFFGMPTVQVVEGSQAERQLIRLAMRRKAGCSLAARLERFARQWMEVHARCLFRPFLLDGELKLYVSLAQDGDLRGSFFFISADFNQGIFLVGIDFVDLDRCGTPQINTFKINHSPNTSKTAREGGNDLEPGKAAKFDNCVATLNFSLYRFACLISNQQVGGWIGAHLFATLCFSLPVLLRLDLETPVWIAVREEAGESVYRRWLPERLHGNVLPTSGGQTTVADDRGIICRPGDIERWFLVLPPIGKVILMSDVANAPDAAEQRMVNFEQLHAIALLPDHSAYGSTLLQGKRTLCRTDDMMISYAAASKQRFPTWPTEGTSPTQRYPWAGSAYFVTIRWPSNRKLLRHRRCRKLQITASDAARCYFYQRPGLASERDLKVTSKELCNFSVGGRVSDVDGARTNGFKHEGMMADALH